MQDIAVARGCRQPPMAARPLTDDAATYDNVRGAFGWIRDQLKPDDLFVFTFAGHGLIRDGQGDGEEPENQAFRLYDQELVDDEIYSWLSAITAPARVLVVLEACYSGSGVTMAIESGSAGDRAVRTPDMVAAMYEQAARRAYVRNPSRWAARINTVPAAFKPKLTANILLLAAATDDGTAETARDNSVPPPFTQALVASIDTSYDYDNLRGNIAMVEFGGYNAIPPVLNDSLLTDAAFRRQRPISV